MCRGALAVAAGGETSVHLFCVRAYRPGCSGWGHIDSHATYTYIYIYIFLHPFRAPEHVSPFGAVSPTRAGIQTPDAEMQSLGAEMQTLGAEMQTLGAVMQTLGAETQTLVLRCSHRC